MAGMDDYLPIAEHGLIGDLHSVALVGTDGTIDWYCCPRFDSPSVFCAILDKGKGVYAELCFSCHGEDPGNIKGKLIVLDHALLVDPKRSSGLLLRHWQWVCASSVAFAGEVDGLGGSRR